MEEKKIRKNEAVESAVEKAGEDALEKEQLDQVAGGAEFDHYSGRPYWTNAPY